MTTYRQQLNDRQITDDNLPTDNSPTGGRQLTEGSYPCLSGATEAVGKMSPSCLSVSCRSVSFTVGKMSLGKL
jgi:hypothetical protein